MKKILLFFALCLAAFPAQAQVQSGPWTGEMRQDSASILWLSETPGMAWVELEDGSCHWETFAGRRVFHRLHRVRLEGLKPGQVVRYRVCGHADSSATTEPNISAPSPPAADTCVQS